MDRIGWLLLSEEDVPRGDDWLSPEEQEVLRGLHFGGRRRDWRLGRFTAKTALQRPGSPLQGAPLPEISVLADDDGVPRVFRRGVLQECSLSLSHRDGRALAVVGPPGASLGCDLEVVEPRSKAFVRDYFTDSERSMVEEAPRAARPCLANLVWSAKESALKALGVGLKVDTRTAEVEVDSPDGSEEWRRLSVRTREGVLEGWWREDSRRVATVVARPVSSSARLA